MAYMSAREMLSGLPVKMAIGGEVAATMPAVRADGAYTQAETRNVYNLIANNIISAADAAEFYGVTTSSVDSAVDTLAAQDKALLAGEARYLADPTQYGSAAETYQTVLDSGFSVQDALDAGVDQSTINQIFTAPADTPAYGGPAPTATMAADVQDYYDKIMVDGIDAAERLAMQKIATDQGLSYADIVAGGVDPNILYGTRAPAGGGGTPVGATPVGATPVDTTPVDTTPPARGGTAATTKICPAGTLLAGQEIGINQSCGFAPKTDDGDESAFGPDGETDAEKAARIAAADAARVAASNAAYTSTQLPYTATPVYQPLPDNTSVYGAGEKSLDTTFRESAPRTEIIDAYGGLVNFDYSPGASLTSATGSGYNFTPPTVTSRPRSLMGANQLGRYTGGRSAADLRQLTTGLGNGRTYSDYAGVLQNPGSYSGGLSKSQLYSRMRGLDYQRDAAAAADRQASTTRGNINAYLAANPDIAASYASQKDRLGAQSLEQFARNHYNTTGRAEMAANKRGDFILVESTGGGGVLPVDEFAPNLSSGMGGYEGEGEDYSTSNFTKAMGLGKAGRVLRPFAQGGPVKKPQGFADGGTASANLRALNKYAGGGIIDSAIQKGAEALGFDDERQVAISQEAVDITNQMVDAGLIGEQYRVELLVPKDASQRTRQNTGIKGDEEVFNAVNHALFAYDAGQSTLGTLGAQAKEVYQGLSRKIGGNDPRSEYLDYFNNKFGFNLAEQGLSREEAKNAIMNNLGNIDNQGTRGRMIRGEELKAGVDLLTNVQDARYPWE